MESPRKKIWYISHYVAPPEFETHLRAIKFAGHLTEAGYDVTIFSSSYLHFKKFNLINDKSKYLEKNYGNIKFIHIKTRKYDSNGLARMYSLFQFAMRIFFLRNKFEKPDYIIHTAHVPFENPIYYVAKSLKAKYIVEILDLWPESFVAYGLMGKKNQIIRLAYYTEKWLYKRADKLVFSMEGGKDYIIEKRWDKSNGGPIDPEKIYHINNGVDLNDFNYNKNYFKIEDPDLEDDKNFKVIYLGSIRLANDVKQIIDAAFLLKDNLRIKFLIYGDGSERPALERFCTENNLQNVVFKQKWIELKYVPYVLSRGSLNIINYMPSGVLKYGGSQGKLFQYLASGKPIISNIKMGYCLIDRYNLGIARDFKSAQEYSDAILQISLMEKPDYNAICQRELEVIKQYDFKLLADKLIKVLNN